MRNKVYVTCALVMVAAIAVEAGNAAYWTLIVRRPDPTHVLLVVEWICFWAFGFSWLVKGDAIPRLADAPATAHQVQMTH